MRQNLTWVGKVGLVSGDDVAHILAFFVRVGGGTTRRRAGSLTLGASGVGVGGGVASELFDDFLGVLLGLFGGVYCVVGQLVLIVV